MANTYELPPRIEPIVEPENGIVQPPVAPPPNRPGRNTNQLEFLSQKVVKAVWNHKLAWPFREPVDAMRLNLPDYHEKIKRPMDLGTIKKRLENRYYCSSSEAIDDFKAIFQNCYTYNTPDNEVVKMAQKLEKMFSTKIAQMPKVEENIEAPKKVDNRKTVSFAPNLTIAFPYDSNEKKSIGAAKSRKRLADQTLKAGASVETSPEPAPQKSKGRRKTVAPAKSSDQLPDQLSDATSLGVAIPDTPAQQSTEPVTQTSKAGAIVEVAPEPAPQKSKGRRKTIAPAKTPDQLPEQLSDATTLGVAIPDTAAELSTEPVTQKSKGRRKTIAAKQSREKVTKVAETVPETSDNPPTEQVMEPKKTPAPRKSRRKAEKLPEATPSHENHEISEEPSDKSVQPKKRKQQKKSRKEESIKVPEAISAATASHENVNSPNEIPNSNENVELIDPNTDELMAILHENVDNPNQNVENGPNAELKANKVVENGANQRQNLIPLDRLSEGEANDSGVDSIPEERRNTRTETQRVLESLQAQIHQIQSVIDRLKASEGMHGKRMSSHECEYSNGNYSQFIVSCFPLILNFILRSCQHHLQNVKERTQV